ncbi:MAG: transporter [Pedosphaera sp.]|nr:transporter [Pedosphaera sp.]
MISFLLKIWGLARPYRVRLFLGVLTGIIAGLLEPLMIATFTFVYQLIFTESGPDMGAQLKYLPGFVQDWLQAAQQALATDVKTHPTAVILVIATIPTVIFLRGLFSYLNIYLLQWTAIRAITDLRIRLFQHLINLPASFFNQTNSGALISRVINDTVALHGIMSNATAVIVKDPVTIVSLLCYLMWREPKLTLISMVVMPLCMIPIVIYGRKVRRTASGMQTQSAELVGVMSESFTANRIIKAYNLENTVVEQFRAVARKVIGHYMRIVRASETPGPLMEIFGAIGVSLVFVYLAFHEGGKAHSADFLAVILAIFSMYRPLKNLARLHNNLEQARAASARVFELLATPNSIPEPANPKTLKAAGADIQFENIEFAFGEKTVLRGVNLTVKAGQLVALVGASGSGKTTLTNLLLRFYDPAKGAVRIGGIDIRDVNSHDLRNQIAVVTQETVLFNETIRRNIELGRPGATNAEIEAAARHAHAHDFIMEKSQGYDTIVGEKGVAISGGQRQRIAIARAIVRNAPILILDEATNALDTESERIVQVALEELMQGRTALCIAHRLSTIQRADVIIVMDQGRIVEMGRHTELLSHDGVYRRLYELQFQP